MTKFTVTFLRAQVARMPTDEHQELIWRAADSLALASRLVRAIKSGDQIQVQDCLDAWGDDDWDPIER